MERFRAHAVPEASDLPREVRSILACIHQRLFDSSLNVSAVRSSCGLRNNNVSTIFRRSMGLGIRQYIESRRLAAAARLLGRPELEVFLIALAVGYENHETFCRAFQRYFGCTPSEFRAQGGEQMERNRQEQKSR